MACYNYTGTPYLENTVLPEVVYSYGLKEAIANKYLKDVDIKGYDNVKSETFLKTVIEDFWNTYGGNTYEGLPPKLAIFGATIDEVVNDIRPAVEKVLSELGIPLDKILVNTGDTTVTKDNDIKAFNDLDVVGTIGSQKQFILLCNKGREGWNCRSLFGVALFRSPKSTIFVLQATMRCLRQITENQQKAIVRLSKENMDILDAELAKNFRVSISEISNSGDGKHKELYKYNGLAIQYIDPETNAIRSYYPDFITTLDDGTIQIIEVKGDNKIDDSVVLAKAAAASEMALESKMEYLMLASTKIMKEKVV